MLYVRHRIRQAREDAGRTQAELALAAGIPLRTLGAYERGSIVPPINRAARIADALGLSLNELFPDTQSVAYGGCDEVAS